jgi:hypothetical protein
MNAHSAGAAEKQFPIKSMTIPLSTRRLQAAGSGTAGSKGHLMDAWGWRLWEAEISKNIVGARFF